MLKPSSFLTVLLAIALQGTAAMTFGADPAKRPNVILIMSDDMGFSDLGAYGGDLQTPHLDALAHGGVRFTQFYNTARCCPTRASLLSGLYPHQAGIGHMTSDYGTEGYRGDLSKKCVTLAEVLRPAGYGTYMTGKWHVTPNLRQDGSKHNWPLQRGFDKYYGTIAGAGNFYNPRSLTRGNDIISPTTDSEYKPDQFYYTDAISDNAVKFLQQHEQESPEKPFFLYVAYTAAHWPMHALEKDIAKFHGKFDDGYGPHREARLKRMKELGILPPETELSPQAENWDAVQDKAWEARCAEVYAAMIDNMDAGIGRIVSQLKESGDYENTLILFLQDNGACAETIGRDEKSGPPAGISTGEEKTGTKVMPGPQDTYIAYGRGWANVSNTPFREYKHWVHEGGISTPLIAHWPAGIPQERNGKLERQPGHLIDIMATLVDVSGATYPEEHAGEQIKQREGVSLRPAFSGEDIGRTQPIFWEHEGNRAVRDGDWKLVAKENGKWELYNIPLDRTESKDLAAEQPERAKELADKWQAYAERANVLPLRSRNGAESPSKPNSKLEVFTWEKTGGLGSNGAPALFGRALKVTANVELKNDESNGVVLAHGGSSFGIALYLDHGKPVLAIRDDGQIHSITGSALTKGKHEIVGELTADGKLHLTVNGNTAADPVQATLIRQQPQDGLQVGRDERGSVGDYKGNNKFSGTIDSVKFELFPAQ
ncbi:arylsulfatase [Planctomicrobium sp. SH668]|uniref:arylsulfatase n=1 Tax=Planctomicrobium sp. SH668 TaxID=3448126 RepID=UPI003F5B2AC8